MPSIVIVSIGIVHEILNHLVAEAAMLAHAPTQETNFRGTLNPIFSRWSRVVLHTNLNDRSNDYSAACPIVILHPLWP